MRLASAFLYNVPEPPRDSGRPPLLQCGSVVAWGTRLLDRNDLLELVGTRMPFGRYRGRPLIDLPEPYLLWFADNGFPEGKLGRLMALALEIKINGLEYLLQPLKPRQPALPD
jgi:uncharacterized protein